MFQKTHLNETGLNQDERYVALAPPFLEPYTSIRPKGTLNEILLKKKVHHMAFYLFLVSWFSHPEPSSKAKTFQKPTPE